MGLTHYASPYYDPVKAHEYYEAHKKLKGRRSTAGLSEEGRIAANYVKKSLNEERKKISDQSRANLKSNLEKISNERRNAIERDRERTKAEIKAHTHKVQTEAAHLRILIESGALKDDPQKRYEALSKIQSLREETNKKRAELQARFQKNSEATRLNAHNKSESLRNEHRNNMSKLRDEYDKKYDDEIDKLQREYGKGAKSSRTSSGNKSQTRRSSNSSEYVAPKKEQTSKWAMRKKERLKKESEARSKSRSSGGGSGSSRTQMYHSDLYLMHHGIKGQRWGIRRYQNEDGSLTPEGEKRYGYSSEGTRKTSSTAKKVAIGAAIVAGTALAAYGGYKLYNIEKDKRAKPLGIEALKKMGIEVFEPERIEINRFEPKRTSILTLTPDSVSSGEDYLSKILRNSQGLSEVTKKNEEFKQTFGDLEDLTMSLLKHH